MRNGEIVRAPVLAVGRVRQRRAQTRSLQHRSGVDAMVYVWLEYMCVHRHVRSARHGHTQADCELPLAARWARIVR